MPAGGFRTFVAGENLDEQKINDYLMQGILVFADSAARGSAIGTAVHGQVSFLKDTNATEFFDGSQWVALGVGTFTAADVTGTTGSPGTATSGGYTYYTFTGTGSITFGRDGLADVLMIGGGGGAGDGDGDLYPSGGGGAGDIRQLDDVFFASGTATITVGAGGAAGSTGQRGSLGGITGIGPGAIGKNHIVVIGGGAGAGGIAVNINNGDAGASGGGSAWRANGLGGRALTQFAGGNTGGSNASGGGGGGATAAGGNASGTTGGAGGAGTNAYATWASATSTGVSDFYAGGGGAGGTSTGGAGGSGGGGAGASGAVSGGNGTANTGSGGGGNENGRFSAGCVPGNGGSGLVIVRVLA